MACDASILFNVVDDFNREVLTIEVDLNILTHRAVRILERLSAERGYPLLYGVTTVQNLLPQHCLNGQNISKRTARTVLTAWIIMQVKQLAMAAGRLPD